MAEAKVVEPAGGKGKKTLMIVIIVAVVVLVLVVALGVVAFLLLRSPAPAEGGEQAASQSEAEGGHQKKEKKKKDAEHDTPPVYEKLQTITANLSSEEEDAVVQTEIVLEVADAETQTQLKNIMPKIQAETIKLIRGRAPAELRTVAGTDKLAGDIRGMVNGLLDVHDKDEGVLSVNFTTFIMQ
ncbi:flagellar basal body-associated FliL family protein [Chitinolyticbacter meiyuanensis]|uniref:flagellar basal body-associated FliL family protein n=1 Tax=Chitinolyticbacter meiyuanensis TaxID=682798 RepID=UPI0011E5D48D|nr:flagellar basal body-associated FliL family protein [Chitinolyticbacter meiyuanensis]